MNRADLIRKYDIPAPRYTSYPTVPYWENVPTTEQWLAELRSAAQKEKNSVSLYFHIPFCESLCTFCGCNTTITKDHGREEPYIGMIHREWNNYLKHVPELLDRPVREIHLGGGTPTFLSGKNLAKLLGPIFEAINKSSDFEASIEVDPRRTTFDHLEALRAMGFNRVSMGVQDFDEEVQRLVNRLQPPDVTSRLLIHARELGFDSINFDLIYGLPKQTLERIKKTVELTIAMRPDRIALYSYAHVPWIKPAQRLFTEADLPVGEEKRKLYEAALESLLEAGYQEIGMDHFALPTDKLSQASERGVLHRNFMGYTAVRTEILLGLGVSAISETPTCFHQNEKALPVYDRRVQNGEVPTFRGHLLTEGDREAREQILELMTKSELFIPRSQVEDIREILLPLIQDSLVVFHETENRLSITEAGRPFLRNVCMAFDRRLRQKQPTARLFSQAL